MIRTMTDKGCENLANAIILQAMKDYLLIREREYEFEKIRDVLDPEEADEKIKKLLEDKWCNKKEIRDFFNSQWFYMLSGNEINADKLFARLDIEHERLMKEKEERKLKKRA